VSLTCCIISELTVTLSIKVSSQLIAIFVVTCYITSYLIPVCCHKKVIVNVTSVYSAISEHNAIEIITSCAMSEFTAAAAITCCAVSQRIGVLRGLLEKYPTFGREKETGLLGALDT
jgi:hypothetical protein